ncbi:MULTISPECIES: hypothetical protein [unclassified Streptomyces]|uniref:hypothetical protein n=1 Tax=unclassified Streptomyces TaxID=2593676 RepID=UPI00081E8D4B|nr:MULTISPECIES: hypothetical protein [unclassified Streptomyces]MYZ39784.1 hypothetical protein [Streptomyces sp. SID4917]SCG05229.1 hypothetical protein GA0115259_109394 [Streptomyces sp. MnatMP-M17]
MSAGRPLTRAERKKYNRAQHERKIRQDLIAEHGVDLGTFYYWLRLMNIRGTQAFRDGDTVFIREVALALENVYRRYVG